MAGNPHQGYKSNEHTERKPRDGVIALGPAFVVKPTCHSQSVLKCLSAPHADIMIVAWCTLSCRPNVLELLVP
jgi:hypothetical protein